MWPSVIIAALFAAQALANARTPKRHRLNIRDADLTNPANIADTETQPDQEV